MSARLTRGRVRSPSGPSAMPGEGARDLELKVLLQRDPEAQQHEPPPLRFPPPPRATVRSGHRAAAVVPDTTRRPQGASTTTPQGRWWRGRLRRRPGAPKEFIGPGGSAGKPSNLQMRSRLR